MIGWKETHVHALLMHLLMGCCQAATMHQHHQQG
jgi:hypothetical protein